MTLFHKWVSYPFLLWLFHNREGVDLWDDSQTSTLEPLFRTTKMAEELLSTSLIKKLFLQKWQASLTDIPASLYAILIIFSWYKSGCCISYITWFSPRSGCPVHWCKKAVSFLSFATPSWESKLNPEVSNYFFVLKKKRRLAMLL